MASQSLVYFVPVEGRAQARFGSGQFVGCKRDRASGRLVWDLVNPVGIGADEHRTYMRDYTNTVRRGDLQAVKLEPIEGGGTLVTVLPGGPAPTEKNGLRAAGTAWKLGAPAAEVVAPAARDAAPARK